MIVTNIVVILNVVIKIFTPFYFINYTSADKKNNEFDYLMFLNWCEKMSEYNLVFICDYKKPNKNCHLIWEKGKEKLFIYNKN